MVKAILSAQWEINTRFSQWSRAETDSGGLERQNEATAPGIFYSGCLVVVAVGGRMGGGYMKLQLMHRPHVCEKK